MDKIQISWAAARVNAGLTQDEASRALGISKNTLVSYEHGTAEPSISKAREMSDLYKMPLDYIFTPSKSNLI